MVDTAQIQQTQPYIDFEQRHNRFLNMLQDNDRNIRKQALTELKRSLTKERSDQVIEYFYRERLVKRLVLCLEDQVEKNREMTIEMISTITERCGLKEESNVLLPAIADRMKKVPYNEQSEEVRVQLIELLDVCLDSDKFQFLNQMGPICTMLARGAQDQNPEMKQKVATFAGRLCTELSDKVGTHMCSTIESLIQNLQHQHSKVRKTTLRGLQYVVIAKGAEGFLNDQMQQLKFTQNDRSSDVRSTFYDVLMHWMTNMEIQQLKQYEHNFVLFLLNGVADEQEHISEKCEQFLETHGRNMKDALKQLGEEDDEGQKLLDDNVEMKSSASQHQSQQQQEEEVKQ